VSADTAKRSLWTTFALVIGLVLFAAAVGLALGSAYEQASLKWLLMALALIAAAGSATALFDVSRRSRSPQAPAPPWRSALGGGVSGACMLGVGVLSPKPVLSSLAIVVGVIACAAAFAQVARLVRERGRKPKA
jgi:peptidoglycan/LPS O-acetylase OafA/YrhL